MNKVKQKNLEGLAFVYSLHWRSCGSHPDSPRRDVHYKCNVEIIKC
jgi:hypothetical protein